MKNRTESLRFKFKESVFRVILALSLLGTSAACVDNQNYSAAAPETGPSCPLPPDYYPETVKIWHEAACLLGQGSGIPPEMVEALILMESGGDPNAGSEAGAQYLTQIMPLTGRDISDKFLNYSGIDFEAAFGPEPWHHPYVAIIYANMYLNMVLDYGCHDKNTPNDGTHSLEELTEAFGAYNGGAGTCWNYKPDETNRYLYWFSLRYDQARFEEWFNAGGWKLLVDAEKTNKLKNTYTPGYIPPGHEMAKVLKFFPPEIQQRILSGTLYMSTAEAELVHSNSMDGPSQLSPDVSGSPSGDLKLCPDGSASSDCVPPVVDAQPVQ